MRFKINFLLKDDSEDNIIIEADTIEELQKIAQQETKKRGAKDAWSEPC
ncbi:MAG: hypothetical protein KAX30_04415 [Candidatus Atribacteria bacterium]|nr:hypothetical protein [Candidatus Atribacteria bacterium]